MALPTMSASWAMGPRMMGATDTMATYDGAVNDGFANDGVAMSSFSIMSAPAIF